MANEQVQTESAVEPESATALEGGSYDVIRRRLLDQATELSKKAEALNQRRVETFGGATWLSDFSTLTGLSTRDLGSIRNFAAPFTTGRLVVEGDGANWRCVAHVQDIARAFMAVVRAPRHVVDNAAFNVGQTSENYRIRDIAAVIADVVPNCKVAFTRASATEAQRYRVDCAKIGRLLPGFRPEWTLRDGILDLYGEFQRAGLSAQDVDGDRFKRARFLRDLMDMHRLDSDLRWCDSRRPALLTAAG